VEQLRESLFDFRLLSETKESSVRAAIDSPAPFSDVIAVDPVIYCSSLLNAVNENFIPARMTIGRMAEWPSR
jgi:hypothetical protein